MHSKAPEETTFILVILLGMCNAIYPEIIVFRMLNLSGIYMYFLDVFYLPVVDHASCVAWSLRPNGGCCYGLVVQVPLFRYSQRNLVQ